MSPKKPSTSQSSELPSTTRYSLRLRPSTLKLQNSSRGSSTKKFREELSSEFSKSDQSQTPISTIGLPKSPVVPRNQNINMSDAPLSLSAPYQPLPSSSKPNSHKRSHSTSSDSDNESVAENSTKLTLLQHLNLVDITERVHSFNID